MADQPGVNVQLVHFRSFDVVKIVFLFRQFFGRSVHLVDDHDGRSTGLMPWVAITEINHNHTSLKGARRLSISSSEKSVKNDHDSSN